MSDAWSRQVMAVAGYEMRKAVAGRRWLGPFVLAAAPVALLALRVPVAGRFGRVLSAAAMETLFAGVFGTYMLRLGIFFAAAAVFVQLYRRDVQERTLHASLLVPIARERILIGKYLAGLVHVGSLFLVSTAASYLLVFLPGGPGVFMDQFLRGPGVGHLAVYLVLTLLATALYGAVFTMAGTLARNPVVLVLLVFLVESFESLLPKVLQRFSIVHGLAALIPGAAPDAAFSLGRLWELASGPALLGAILLGLAAWRMRRAEVNYSTD